MFGWILKIFLICVCVGVFFRRSWAPMPHARDETLKKLPSQTWSFPPRVFVNGKVYALESRQVKENICGSLPE